MYIYKIASFQRGSKLREIIQAASQGTKRVGTEEIKVEYN